MTDETVIQKAEQEQVSQLLAELRHGPVPLAGATERDAQRQRLMPVLREQVRAVPRVRQRRRSVQRFSYLAVAAGVVGGGFTLAQTWRQLMNEPVIAELRLDPHGGEVELVQSGRSQAIEAVTTIAAGGVMESVGVASLTTEDGVRVEMAERTRVGLDGMRKRSGDTTLRLLQGRVDCDIPPLGSKRRFSVVTPSAEVIVHGTRFSVNMDAVDRTCVRVSEGLVEVNSGGSRRFLSDGQQWGCDEATPSEGASLSHSSSAEANSADKSDNRVAAGIKQHTATRTSEPKRRSPKPAARQEEKSLPEQAREETIVGTLGQETQLLSRALAAERRGERSVARKLYSELLRRYPASPLAPEARKGHARVE